MSMISFKPFPSRFLNGGPSPNLVAVDKGQKCARPVMLPRPLVEGIFTGLIQNKIFNYSFKYFVGQNWKNILSTLAKSFAFATGEVYMTGGALG